MFLPVCLFMGERVTSLASTQFIDSFASLWKAVNYRGDADKFPSLFPLFQSPTPSVCLFFLPLTVSLPLSFFLCLWPGSFEGHWGRGLWQEGERGEIKVTNKRREEGEKRGCGGISHHKAKVIKETIRGKMIGFWIWFLFVNNKGVNKGVITRPKMPNIHGLKCEYFPFVPYASW